MHNPFSVSVLHFSRANYVRDFLHASVKGKSIFVSNFITETKLAGEILARIRYPATRRTLLETPLRKLEMLNH